MRNFILNVRKRRQKGLTLIEATSVLAIGIIAAAAVMLYFQNASTNQKTNAFISQIAAIQSGVQTLYSGQPTYTGLTTQTIAESGMLPAKMIDGALVKHSFNADVTITEGGSADTFTVLAAQIPNDACQKIVTMDLGRNVQELSTSDGETVSKQAMSPVQAQAACTSSRVDITWEFY